MKLILNNKYKQKLSAEIIQNKSSILAIFVHGFKGNKDYPPFLKIEKKLSDAGFDTLRFDFSGNGGSEGKFSDSTILNQSKELDYIIKKFNYKKVILIGHSMGGAVSIIESTINPKIKCIILLNPLIFPYITFKDSIIKFSPYVMLNVIKHKHSKLGNIFPTIEKVEDNLIKTLKNNTIGKEFTNELRTLDIIEYSKMLKIPVLIIHGKFDDVIPVSHAEYFYNLLNTGKKMIVHYYNHNPLTNKLTNIISDDVLKFIIANKKI